MRRSSSLSIHTHAALEVVLGAALIVLPFALGMSGAALILGILLGGLLIGIALVGSEPGGRGGLPLSAHAVYDWALAMALVGAAIALGVAEGTAPLIIFLCAGAAELTLTASTSYSARRA